MSVVILLLVHSTEIVSEKAMQMLQAVGFKFLPMMLIALYNKVCIFKSVYPFEVDEFGKMSPLCAEHLPCD